ncbi:MAG: starch synthase [Candidatus Kerfeldbacteria bacterium CG_4_10_14_0_8_um_filter_42_10]|uniref:Glycogen synthase n=1 Tax=Candidatus Kerfeldbacteria bacterium CG_4_10_14_0_8_um_filter_42_10 TaxID=2014248 RepID=A0A2M7RJJ7_9BACT|nr:MAG: starch synthase [Candidatus Kerfeldbacteria bacterium CG_4_10_14_0_8_um_filter_42_10]
MSKIKVLFVAAELTPLAKVGGLADVIGALPKALAQLKVDVRIVIPKYGIVDEKKYKLKKVATDFTVPFKGKEEKAALWKTTLPGSAVPVYLIDHPEFLGENGVYYEKDASSGGTPKECRRFTFFVRATMEIFGPLKWQPDIIHCHDWHVGILPALIKILNKQNPERSPDFTTILTIHNLAFQGKYVPDDVFSLLEIKENDWPTLKERFGKNQDLNYLQQAILNSDLINTVSPTYSHEILTPEYGENLESTLQKKAKILTGILNGIDTDRFNPATDPEIKLNYSLKDFIKKKENKQDLQQSVQLPPNPDIPVVGLVSRITDQKGIDLICQIIDELATLEIQLVFLGLGSKPLEQTLEKEAQKYPKKIAVRLAFDAHLAQQIYAGSDLFLMPSRFEPCGLGQMIAMRYGTVPIVRATGGLKDTVQNFNPQTKTGTGFVFQNYESQELLATIKKALTVFSDQNSWNKLIQNSMSQDFSWLHSAQRYLALYQKALLQSPKS